MASRKSAGPKKVSMHNCTAVGCPCSISATELFCGPHWATLPMPMREEICIYHTPGQEAGAKIKPEFVRAQRQAIHYIAKSEGRIPEPETDGEAASELPPESA